MRFVLSCDVEEWFQVENLRPVFSPSVWDAQSSRVTDPIRRILDLYYSENVKHATFFLLGWVAKRHPELVKLITDSGFEIASHGMDHRSNFELNPSERLVNLTESMTLLEDISGRPVRGYRAPTFTVDENLLDLVGQCGYSYDSSFNPFGMHDRYGRLDLSLYGRETTGGYRRPENGLLEFPVAVRSAFGRAWPWGGGGYFRLYPAAWYRNGVIDILRTDGVFVFYFHPWELDPGQPRVRGIGASRRFRHYVNLDKTESRLRELIRAVRDVGAEITSLEALAGFSKAK